MSNEEVHGVKRDRMKLEIEANCVLERGVEKPRRKGNKNTMCIENSSNFAGSVCLIYSKTGLLRDKFLENV